MSRPLRSGVLSLCLAVLIAGTARGASENPSPSAAKPAQRFAVTLTMSLTPTHDFARIRSQFPGWTVYETRATVAGTEAYVVRVGFFNDITEASAVRRRVRPYYPDAWTSAVPNSEYLMATASERIGPSTTTSAAVDLSAGAEPKTPPPMQAPPQPVAPSANIFAVELRAYRERPRTAPWGIPARYQDYQLYLIKPTEGDDAYRLNLGFFTNRNEARRARDALLANFPLAAVIEVSGKDQMESLLDRDKPLVATLPPTKAAAPAASEPSPTAAAVEGAAAAAGGAAAIAGTAGEAAAGVAGTTATTAGSVAIPSTTGPSAPPVAATTAAPAPAEAPSAAPTAETPSVALATPPPTPSPTTTPAPLPPSPPPAASLPADPDAAALIAQAREALTNGENTKAVALLDQVLRRPPSASSQEAQELIGVARERAGDTRRAKAEYDLYLKVYPTGEGADRVRQRLANLDTPTVQAGAPAKRERPTQTLFFGSISQYYYKGNSKVETKPFDINGNPLNTDTLTFEDQSSLITNVDLNARIRSERFDQRVVVRDTNTVNFLKDQDNDNRLNAAYYDLQDKQVGYGMRLGRQPGNIAGILLPFDGATFSYNINPRWRANVRAGQLVDYYSDFNKDFWSVSLDVGPFAENWTGTVYAERQEEDNMLDRQAVGTEIRYLDQRRSILALLDYDTSYDVLNIGTLQGTWQTESKLIYNFLVDQRKSPPLMLTNALIGETMYKTLNSMRRDFTEDQIRQFAEARTAEVKQYQFGVTYPVSNWQLSGDVLKTNISGTETINSVPGTPGTGDQYTYSLQGTGTGVFGKRDSLTIRGSYVTAETFDGYGLSVFQRSLLGQHWTLDLNVIYYEQTDDMDTHFTRTIPTIKVGYLIKPNLVFEIEYGVETTVSESNTSNDTTTRQFGSIGYRWDF